MSDPVFSIVGGAAAAPMAAAAPSASGGSQTGPAPGESGEATRAVTRAYVDRGADGVYVYRLVDVATGRVLAELPRSEGGSPKLSLDYAPGALASASV